jgi:hypothetical protein
MNERTTDTRPSHCSKYIHDIHTNIIRQYSLMTDFYLNTIFSQLPDEIIRTILFYDSRFIWRENQWIVISPFLREDYRYRLLEKIPKKFNMSPNSWSVILGEKKRMVMGYRNVVNNEWEYFFSIFAYDSLMQHSRDYPEFAIYYQL